MAIDNALTQLAALRRGDPNTPELSIAQIRSQMRLAVDRVMTEGSVYDPDLAALAIKQAAGDLVEAIFLLRAYRSTLPRLGYTEPIDTARMSIVRRISATFKDLPGGQILGPTYDYTQRLLDFTLAAQAGSDAPVELTAPPPIAKPAVHAAVVPRVTDLLAAESLIEMQPRDDSEPFDLTRQPLQYPADRAARLQNLARGDEGFLLAMAYSTQRGYAHSHPFAGEIRHGWVQVDIVPPELGFAISIGELALTECQMINQFAGDDAQSARFTRGYGLAFGHSERKAMAMALVDRSLRAEELGEPITAAAQMQEFVLAHSDNLEASGFVQHLKLPHYVDFQSELELLRTLRRQPCASAESAAATQQDAA